MLVADPGGWFQYYWWDDREEAPAYASDVDIHDKPGFDPCELFVGEEGMVSLDPTKVGGSHGRVDDATLPMLGFGGPAADGLSLPSGEPVDARTVGPALLEALGAGDATPGGDRVESPFAR